MTIQDFYTRKPAWPLRRTNIIYIADYIEPGRDQAPRLEEIRRLAFQDLDRCMAEILFDALNYLNGRKGTIDPTTKKTWDYYEHFRKEQP